jgi:uncharacterized membrane protein
MVVVPDRRFSEHLALGLGLIRRYGAREPTVAQALLRLLTSCAALSVDDADGPVAERGGIIRIAFAQLKARSS